MIDIYNAIGVQVNTFDCKYNIKDKPDYKRNLDRICNMINSAVLHSLEYPPKLIALCEGAIQGFPDEFHDWEHVEYARSGAIEIPGPETDRLSEMAVKWDAFIIGQAKARKKEFPDRFFNVMFIIDPTGKGLNDFCLRSNGEGRDIVCACQSCPPGGGAITCQ